MTTANGPRPGWPVAVAWAISALLAAQVLFWLAIAAAETAARPSMMQARPWVEYVALDDAGRGGRGTAVQGGGIRGFRWPIQAHHLRALRRPRLSRPSRPRTRPRYPGGIPAQGPHGTSLWLVDHRSRISGPRGAQGRRRTIDRPLLAILVEVDGPCGWPAFRQSTAAPAPPGLPAVGRPRIAGVEPTAFW